MPLEDDYESTIFIEPPAEEPVKEVPVEAAPAAETQAAEPPAVPSADELEVGPDGQPVLDEAGQPKKKMGGFQRRIERLSRKLQEKDMELEFLRRYVPPAPGGSQTTAPPTLVQPQPGTESEPTRDQFESNDQYVKAVAQFAAKQAVREFQQTQTALNAQTEQKKNEETFNNRVKSAPGRFADWADVMEDTRAPSTPVMEQIIKRSDVGIDLMYYLAKNEAEATRIAQLPDVLSQSMAMGVLEQRFKSTQSAHTPKAPGAPPPITPVSSSTHSVAKNVKDMDGDEYLAFMRQSQKS